MSGLAYFVGPEHPGQPVLLLPSWFGLSDETKRMADRLADEECTVLVPDLLEGELPTSDESGEAVLKEADPNQHPLAPIVRIYRCHGPVNPHNSAEEDRREVSRCS